MAILYFSNNADSGTGSLRAAIASAQPGDVVRPDKTVFERGSTIEIVLASPLRFTKDLTLDASPFRVRLDGGGSRQCVVVAESSDANAVVEFTSFDFVRGKTSGTGGGIFSGGTLTLNRCGTYGCSGGHGGGVYCRYFLTLNDCVVTGCRATSSGGGIYASRGAALNGVTLMGNVSPRGSDVRFGNGDLDVSNSIIGGVYSSSSGSANYVGSVVDVASSAVGFVASPPDDLTVENWDADAWQNWDLRLLDDASDAPSPYRDSGDVDKMSRYDLQGNFRGRETNGASTCSPGAYETIQADLFWIGRDATGAEVVAPSFLTSDSWAASRFADVSGDAAPSNANSLFVGVNVAFADTISSSGLGAIVGDGAGVELSDGITTFRTLIVGAGSTVKQNSSRISVAKFFRLGSNVIVDSMLQITDSWGDPSWSDAAAQVRALEAYAPAPTEPRYGLLAAGRTATGKVFLNGCYECDRFAVLENGSGAKYALNVAPGATIRCRQFDYKVYSTGRNFSNQVVVELYGAAVANVIRSDGATLDVSGDFVLDVGDATSATLNLDNQTVYSDAPTAEITLTGSAKIAERGLDVASLTLNAGSTLNVDGASVNVAELTVADGATVAFSPAASPDATGGVNVIDETNATDKTTGTNATDGAAATYVDAVLSATTSATVGAATFSGTGYFATPQGTDVTSATFETYVRRVDYSAGVETFAATATGPTTATLAWSATDETARVCVERENAAAPNGWEVVAITPTEDASPLEVALSGKERFRIFDGFRFLFDEAYFSVKSFYVYKISSTQREVASYSLYSRKAQMVRANIEGSRNENVLLIAQIKNLLTGEYLMKANVESIVASVYKVEKGVQAGDVWTEQADWKGTEVPLDSLLESPIMIEGWTNDEVGANFVWTPNTMEKKLFTEGGKYVIQVTFNLPNENPIVISFNASVK